MAKNIARSLTEALALQQQGRWGQAEVLLCKALASEPGNAKVLCQMALLKTETGAFAEAYYFVTSALEVDSRSVAAHVLLGRILLQTDSPEAALRSYDQALVIQPRNAEALFGRGVVLQRLERFLDALDSYDSALAVSPDQAEVWCNHGNVLFALRRFEEALRSFDEGLKRKPEVALLHFNRANSLNELARVAEALSAYDRAMLIDPRNVNIRNNRGNARLEAGATDGAAEDFRRMIADAPSDARGYNGLGMVLQDQGLFSDAEKQYKRAVTLDPGFADARHNLALVHLFQHDFSIAWTHYERRCDPRGYRSYLRKDALTVDQFERVPRWTGPGNSIDGLVGIWGEQGIGDQILFSTLLPELASLGQPFIYEVDSRLLQAYQRAFPDLHFVALNDPPDQALSSAGAALFAGSLPGLFRPSTESFTRQPHRVLQASPERAAHYRNALGPGPSVAFSWRSNRVGRLGRTKSAALNEFSPLLALSGVRFVDVQYGDTANEREALLKDFGTQFTRFENVDYYNDLDEVLAILEACDLLITTSNANAHLAAALGKPVWLLYLADRAPFHYWAHGEDHRCLWYPSVEIVSAPELTEWPQLITRVTKKLHTYF